MADDEDLVTAGFDAVYRVAPRNEWFTRLWLDLACRDDYPAMYGHISFLLMRELDDLVADLALEEDALLIDLACGAGGPGLAVATRASSRLIGVDLSWVGVGEARSRAARLDHVASFLVGSVTALPLADNSADAAMSVDALQYASDKVALFDEVARVLRPGAVLAFTAFETDPERVRDLPVLGTDPVADYRPLLEATGFACERYEQTAAWRERLVTAYQGVLAARRRLSRELGAEAVAALELEMTVTLDVEPYCGRAYARARRIA